jgi:aminoglycoside/choline kinase family phosphotransferase
MTQPLAPLTPDQPTTALLAACGLGDVAMDPLPGDASARRYVRLTGTGRLLMEDRTDRRGFDAFVRLSRHLGTLGLSAPRVFDSDPDNCLAVIEDFGAATYGALLADGYDEATLYALAIDVLVHLHGHSRATAVTVPPYDMDLLLQELSIFSDWFVPAFAPHVDVPRFDAAFTTLWRTALAPVLAAPPALVLRDFHIDNLMLLERRAGVAACGLLDFQDAVLGAAEYDLMSLLQDARRDLAPGLEDAMLARYLAAVPAACGTADEIMQRYYLTAAQRHTRLVGLFPRLNRRDGKPGYMRFMPRVVRQMQTALQDARLPEIADFLDTELPGWRDAGTTLRQMP